jgi:hypothetical protein
LEGERRTQFNRIVVKLLYGAEIDEWCGMMLVGKEAGMAVIVQSEFD